MLLEHDRSAQEELDEIEALLRRRETQKVEEKHRAEAADQKVRLYVLLSILSFLAVAYFLVR